MQIENYNMVIAVDFDGTIVTHRYPEIGAPVVGAIETLKCLHENGHKIFLWTMRGNKRYNGRDLLQEAVEYCEDNGITLYSANQSPSQFSSSKKQYAQIYIDDAALGCPLIHPQNEWDRPYVDWQQVGLNLKKQELITDEQFSKIWNV